MPAKRFKDSLEVRMGLGMVSQMEKVAILGAGAGGRSAAVDFTTKDCKVNLYNRSTERIEAIMKKGGIEAKTNEKSGVRAGFAKLNKVTTNIAEALEQDVEIIFVLTIGNAHRDLIEASAPFLHEGQVIFFAPGNGGALECARILKDKDIGGVTIAESLSLFYGCRVTGPAEVTVTGRIGPNLRAAAFPAEKTMDVINKVKNYVPLIKAKNVLETTMMNPNPLIHPIPTLLNIGVAESNPEEFASYGKNVMTPSVLKAIGHLDSERQNVCKTLGIDSRSLDEIYDEIGIGPIYREDRSPEKGYGNKIYHREDRFISEDVPYGLVPWSSIAKSSGVPTPSIDATIQLASIIMDVDYFKEGLKVERMGNRYLEKGID
jgi:opine dehydrogenase